MINKSNKKRITWLALILWVLQASVAFSSTVIETSLEAALTESAQHSQNYASSDSVSCHDNNGFSCEEKHCPSCFVMISPELTPLMMVVEVTLADRQIFRSPQYASYHLYHPPQ